MKWIFSKWILDSLFSGILDSKSWILDSRAQYSGFHKQKFPGFRNPDYLTWGDFFTLFVRFILGFPFLLNRFLGEQMHWLFKCHGSHKPRTNNLFHSGSLSMSPSCDNNTFSFLVTVPAEERRASHFYFSDNQESKESLIKVFLVSWKFCDYFIHKPAVKTTN